MSQKLKLSYTKLSFYLACPKRYYYRYVEKRPFYPTMMAKYGSNIHRTIKDISEIVLSGGVADEAVQKTLLEKQWSDVTSDRIKNLEFKNLGMKQIQEFSEKNREIAENTLFLEKSFKFPLENIILNGYIDRIDRLDGNKVEIIDYKTGNLRELFSDDLQLNFYALICRDHLDLVPEKLSLYFLKTNEKISVEADNKNIDTTKKLIMSISDRILSEDFTPTRINPEDCANCSYSKFCPCTS